MHRWLVVMEGRSPLWRERRNCHTSIIQRGCKFSPRKDERALSKKQQLLFGNGWSMASTVRCNCVSFHRLRKVGFFSRSYLSFLLSASFHNHPTNPLSRASSYLVPWKSLSFLELLETLSLRAVSLSLSIHPRVGKIAVSILSPSELYTRYIMNIVISRRSYTVRSFLKWKSTGKVGRGFRVTFHLLDPPALESSYRLSRLSSTSSVAFATVTYFTFSIASLFSSILFSFFPPLSSFFK